MGTAVVLMMELLANNLQSVLITVSGQGGVEGGVKEGSTVHKEQVS